MIRFCIALIIFGPFFRALAEISSLIRKVHPGRNDIYHTTLVFDTPRPLLSIVKDTRLSIRHGEGGFGSTALGQDQRGVRVPAGIDTGLLPSHNGWSTDIHIQGRSMKRNCTKQQACSICRFLLAAYLLSSVIADIFRSNFWIFNFFFFIRVI